MWLEASLPNQLAEREGFEPPELTFSGFQDRPLRPLGHLSQADAHCPRNVGDSAAVVNC